MLQNKASSTSAVLLASLIIDSRPPKTMRVESGVALGVSPSESLSSEALSRTTTALCRGSYGQKQRPGYFKSTYRRNIAYPAWSPQRRGQPNPLNPLESGFSVLLTAHSNMDRTLITRFISLPNGGRCASQTEGRGYQTNTIRTASLCTLNLPKHFQVRATRLAGSVNNTVNLKTYFTGSGRVNLPEPWNKFSQSNLTLPSNLRSEHPQGNLSFREPEVAWTIV